LTAGSEALTLHTGGGLESTGALTVGAGLTVTGDLTLEAGVGSAYDLVLTVDAASYTMGKSLLSVPVPMTVTGTATATDVVSSSLSAAAGESLVLETGAETVTLNSSGGVATTGGLSVGGGVTVTGDLTLNGGVTSSVDFGVEVGAKSYTIGETLLSVPVPLTVTGAATATSLVSSSLEAATGEALVLESDNETLTLNSAGGVSTSGALSVGAGLTVTGTLSAAGDTTIGTAAQVVVSNTLDSVSVDADTITVSGTDVDVAGADIQIGTDSSVSASAVSIGHSDASVSVSGSSLSLNDVSVTTGTGVSTISTGSSALTLSATAGVTIGTATNYIALDTSVTETLDISTVAEVAITSGAITLSATTTTVTGAVDMTLAQPSMADLSLTGTLTVPAIAATGPLTIDTAAAKSVSIGSLEGNVSLGREDAGSVSMKGAIVDILTVGTGTLTLGSATAPVTVGGSLLASDITSVTGSDITLSPNGQADVIINAGQTASNKGIVYIGTDHTDHVEIQSDLIITSSVVSDGADILFTPDDNKSVRIAGSMGGGLVVTDASDGSTVFSAITGGVTCTDVFTAGSLITDSLVTESVSAVGAADLLVASPLRSTHSSGVIVGLSGSPNLTLLPESVASTGVLAVSAASFALKSSAYAGSHTALEWNDTDSLYMLGDPDNSGSVLVDTLTVDTSLTVDRIVGVGAGVELEHLTFYGSDISSAGSLSLTAPSGLTLTTNTVTASTADVSVKTLTATTSVTVSDITLSAGSISTGASLLRINSLGVTGDTITSPVTNTLTVDVTTVSLANLTITAAVTVPVAEVASKLVVGDETDPNYIVLTSDSITSPDLTLTATSLDINGVSITAGSALTAASLSAASATLSGTLTVGSTLTLSGTAITLPTGGSVLASTYNVKSTGGSSYSVISHTAGTGIQIGDVSEAVALVGTSLTAGDLVLTDNKISASASGLSLELESSSGVKVLGTLSVSGTTLSIGSGSLSLTTAGSVLSLSSGGTLSADSASIGSVSVSGTTIVHTSGAATALTLQGLTVTNAALSSTGTISINASTFAAAGVVGITTLTVSGAASASTLTVGTTLTLSGTAITLPTGGSVLASTYNVKSTGGSSYTVVSHTAGTGIQVGEMTQGLTLVGTSFTAGDLVLTDNKISASASGLSLQLESSSGVSVLGNLSVSGNIGNVTTLTATTVNVTTLNVGGGSYALPTNDGSSGQVLTTDGSGAVSWAGASVISSASTYTLCPGYIEFAVTMAAGWPSGGGDNTLYYDVGVDITEVDGTVPIQLLIAVQYTCFNSGEFKATGVTDAKTVNAGSSLWRLDGASLQYNGYNLSGTSAMAGLPCDSSSAIMFKIAAWDSSFSPNGNANHLMVSAS
ncbi:hypothetical protein KIPB_009082, partial [Kipferlia bialata]